MTSSYLCVLYDMVIMRFSRRLVILPSSTWINLMCVLNSCCLPFIFASLLCNEHNENQYMTYYNVIAVKRRSDTPTARAYVRSDVMQRRRAFGLKGDLLPAVPCLVIDPAACLVSRPHCTSWWRAHFSTCTSAFYARAFELDRCMSCVFAP